MEKAALHPLSSVEKVIAVIGGKGGVGKSLVTDLLAVTLQRRGYNVGILDADLTGPSVPRAFGLAGNATGSSEGIYPEMTKFGIQVMSMDLLLEDPSEPVVWRGAVLSEYVKSFYGKVVWSGLDVLLVDAPPGTGDVPLTVLSALPLSGVVVVSTPQELAAGIAEKAVREAKTLGVRVLGAVLNQAYYECPDCGKRHYIYGKKSKEELKERFGAEAVCEIPIDGDLPKQTDAGLIELFEGDYTEKFCDELEKVW